MAPSSCLQILRTSVYVRLTGLQPSRDSPVSSSHLTSRSTRVADVHPASSKCWGSKPRSSLLPITEPSPHHEKTFSSHVAYDEKNTERRHSQCRPEVNYMGRNRLISQYWGLRIFNQHCGLIVFKYVMRNIIPFFFQTGRRMPSLLFDFNMTALLILTVCYNKSINRKVAMMGECNALNKRVLHTAHGKTVYTAVSCFLMRLQFCCSNKFKKPLTDSSI